MYASENIFINHSFQLFNYIYISTSTKYFIRLSVVMVPVIPLKLQGVPISLPDQGTAYRARVIIGHPQVQIQIVW